MVAVCTVDSQRATKSQPLLKQSPKEDQSRLGGHFSKAEVLFPTQSLNVKQSIGSWMHCTCVYQCGL